MFSEEAFNATRDAFWQYGLFFKAVSEEFGLEKALELRDKGLKPYCLEITKAIRAGIEDELDLKAVGSFLEKVLASGGWETKMILENPKSIILRHTKCPEAEGLLQAGLDPNTVKTYCRRTTQVVTPYLKDLVPGLRMGVRKWNAPKSCDEELVIE